jgi:osmotically inducible protein OsmC
VSLDKVDGAFAITSSHLNVVAVIPGASAAQFAQIANQAKLNCPVSKALNTKITMEATLST